MKHCHLTLLSLLCIVYSASSQDPWAAEGSAGVVPAVSFRERDSVSLDSMFAALKGAWYGDGREHSSLYGDLYSEAYARLEATRSFLTDHPSSPHGPSMLRRCALLTDAVLLERAIAVCDSEVTALERERFELYKQISDVHETINRLEKSRAANLKAQLEVEQQKAQKLRDEANRRFKELQSTLIQVKEDARGTIISMSDILFDVGKATLKAELKTNLAKIAGILTVIKDAHVIVEGHTDNQGTAQYNQRLSEQRAENVREFLVSQGIMPHRLTAVGYGFTRPIADNATSKGRAKNRRVDLVIQDQTN